MKEANKLLEAGSSVSNACFSVGYQSVTTFTAVFRKLTGKLPSVAKKAILKK